MWLYEVKMWFDSQFSRVNWQTFSTGFNSGDLAGSGMRVALQGATSRLDCCHPPDRATPLPFQEAEPSVCQANKRRRINT